MKGSVAYQSIQKRGLHIGLLPAMAAAVNASTPITLDHDLDVLPEAGRHLTTAHLADLVDDLAARLWAAGVRPDEHIVLHKRANADVWMLACAASRIGAVPVMLSPGLDARTVGALLERIDRPNLLTDTHKLDVLAEVPVARLTRRVLIVCGERADAVSLGALAGAPRVRPVVRPLDEAAVITHTSGTTGLPKLVVHTPAPRASASGRSGACCRSCGRRRPPRSPSPSCTPATSRRWPWPSSRRCRWCS